MSSIRILRFAGIRPELSARLKPATNAQVAHNCLLTDGSLRPQAKWVRILEYDSQFESSIRGVAFDWGNDTPTMYASFDPVTLEGEPFGRNITVGASPDSIINRYATGAGLEPRTVAVYSDGVAGTVAYQRSYDSIKPVNRIYALTRVRRTDGRTEESSLIPIPGQSPTDVVYEGDLVQVEVNASALDDDATHIRIYRTISGLDTGDNVTNPLDTNWHLVDELPLLAGNVMTYVDGASATALPLDACYSQNFHPPQLVARYFGLSESGWFVAGSVSGDIQISERYMHHAWPVDNWLRLQGEEITDLAVHKDNVYVGTLRNPYIVALSAGENGLQAAATPFPESIPCLPNTLTSAAAGAIYASGQGLVALSREGQQVLTREVANAGDVLYSKQLADGRLSEARISNTSFGTYHQGQYIGFCEGPPIDDGLFLTTTLYPMEVIESLQASGGWVGGGGFGIIHEYLTASAGWVGGEVRPILQGFSMEPEYLTASADWIGGTLTGVLLSAVATPEHITGSGMLIGGEMQTLLLSTYTSPEPMTGSGSLIEGHLE